MEPLAIPPPIKKVEPLLTLVQKGEVPSYFLWKDGTLKVSQGYSFSLFSFFSRRRVAPKSS